jgi:hypothetical protein
MKPRMNGPGVDAQVEIKPIRNPREIWPETLFGGILALFVGLFVLWLHLTVVGFIHLRWANPLLLQSPGLTIGIASWIAVILCGDGLPLILPWFLAFLISQFFLPTNSILWKWWIRTSLGMVTGVLALWIDALVYSLIGSGTLSGLNVPLLRSASLPAAILAGAICCSAAAGHASLGTRRTQRSAA